MSPRRTDDAHRLSAEDVAKAFAELGLEVRQHGDARDRAQLIGVTPRTVDHWVDGRNPAPEILRSWLQLYRLLTAEQREQFRRIRREYAAKKRS